MKRKSKILLSLILVLTMLIGYSPTVVINATGTDATTAEGTSEDTTSEDATESTSEDVIEEESIDSKTAPAGEFATGEDIPKDLFTTDASYEDEDGNANTDYYTADILSAIDSDILDMSNIKDILTCNATLSPTYKVVIEYNSKYYAVENPDEVTFKSVEDTDVANVLSKASDMLPHKVLKDNKDKLSDVNVYIYNAGNDKALYTFKFSDIGKYISYYNPYSGNGDEEDGDDEEDTYSHTISITDCTLEKADDGTITGALLLGKASVEIVDVSAMVEESITDGLGSSVLGFVGTEDDMAEKSKDFYLYVDVRKDCTIDIITEDENGGEGYLEYKLGGISAVNEQPVINPDEDTSDIYIQDLEDYKAEQEAEKNSHFTLTVSDIPAERTIDIGETIKVTLSSSQNVYLSGAGQASKGLTNKLVMEINANGTYSYQGTNADGNTQSGYFTVACFKEAKSHYQEPTEDPWGGVSDEEYLVQTGIFNSNRPLMLLSIWGMMIAVCGIVLLIIKKVREVR